MRATSFFSILFFIGAVLLPKATMAAQTREVVVGINEAFIPGGFDIYSDTYVIASGIFPNGCYKWSRADVRHVDEFNHEIKSIASVQPGMCIMVLIPFNKEIRLGRFNAGKHSIKFVSGDGTFIEKTMVVEE
ncbi:MAG: hypothetical protein L6Q37_00780 [Bdellovibrionaceae bacterium]|nr:hypothetical protein [Pseudobdellovibrionaceae bacterium]NUM57519.1 hypothetical protein [Pseudobdellovibrionaceae bacterium]